MTQSALAVAGDIGKHSRMAEEDIVLQVVIDDIVFQREDGGFTIARGVRDPGGQPVTIVGELGMVSPGEVLRVTGRFTQHPTFGTQFSAKSFTPIVPTSREGMKRFLGSGLIPGVGPALAERLVERFGDRTLDVIATQAAKLREVEGIGGKRADAIAEAVRSRREEAEALSFLHGLGLGRALARKVREKYGASAARVVRDDPYLVAEEVRGIGWETADRIGRAIGIADDDPRRAAGAITHLVGRAADEGHVFLDRESLANGARALRIPIAPLEEALIRLVSRGTIILDAGALYAPPLYRAERDLARDLGALARPRSMPDGADRALSAVPTTLTVTQGSAVRASFEYGLVVLTGGPGTGKTTTVRAIVQAHTAVGHRIALCAPTGRAAKRLSELSGAEARTIHRTLEWSGEGFRKNREDPLDVELVLVDEASMLDLLLASRLVEAIPRSTRVVFVGDVDQLPPVGAGHVLREVLESGVGKVVRLIEVFRQAQKSAIVRGAHAVLHGRLPEATPHGQKGDGDLFLIRAEEPSAIEAKLLASIERLASAYELDAKRDIQVLSPMRKGGAGTDRLNLLLQQRLNPPRGQSPPPGVLRPGDKVMQLRNDYDKEVFNGDLGEVLRVDGGSVFVDMDGREVQYRNQEVEQLTLAYACTVHKVQGSEFPAIVVVMHGSHFPLLSRALLYTAVTRAKKVAVLLGAPAAFGRAARNASGRIARSRLAERLVEATGGSVPAR